MTKPITNAVSHAFQALERDIGSIGADSVYELIKAVIAEQSLPDELGPEIFTASTDPSMQVTRIDGNSCPSCGRQRPADHSR